MTEGIELPMRILTPDGRWAIEVTEDPNGQFCAVVVLDNKDTIESLHTDDSDKLINWVVRQMHEVMRRQGNEQSRKTC